MIELFRSVILNLFLSGKTNAFSPLIESFLGNGKSGDDHELIRDLNSAFLISIAGKEHPMFTRANGFINSALVSGQWKKIAEFYKQGIDLVLKEIADVSCEDKEFQASLTELSNCLAGKDTAIDLRDLQEKIWAVFFPEALNINRDRKSAIASLRARRIVNILELNQEPITDPVNEILFTSNVLLTVPSEKHKGEAFYTNSIRERLKPVFNEEQTYWFDHPIQIGVSPQHNEVLYGLKGLEKALFFEKERGIISNGSRLTCILSVSVTHRGLQVLARDYLNEQINNFGGLKNLDVYAFTETDTQRIIHEILYPAARHYLGYSDLNESMEVFGVNGEYGRHYSFLKAVSPLWQIMVNKDVKATFKIDLDQVFPQEELAKETHSSAFEHFLTPLWGARGIDQDGEELEFGMIAGALVNEKDISKGLFTPDVDFPEHKLKMDEYVFFSPLPQALSTKSEMMTRYDDRKPDGRTTCIQRFHVTGGTNGILIKSLKEYRPFSPSFMGRAEDQAYILSVLARNGPKLAYVHKDGLIMRHDKEAFAQQAMESARISKLVGDYIRILYFSKYASILPGNLKEMKKKLDPFTGCFISRIPITVVYLRYCLQVAEFFASDGAEDGFDLVVKGAERINNAIDFVYGNEDFFKRQFEKERRSWNIYYDILSAMDKALKENDRFAVGLKDKFNAVIKDCLLGVGR